MPEDELVAKAFDADKHLELAQAIEKLNPEEAQFFLEKLERAIRKRKIMITGYLAAMLVWVLGMVGGLIYSVLGRVPRSGEELHLDGFRVVVERVDRRRVTRVYFERE